MTKIALLFSVLLSITLKAQNLPVDDDKFGCTDKSEAEKFIADMNIDLNSFGGLELCNTKIDTKKLFNDLSLIENGHFNSTGQNLFIKGFIPGANYYNWFKSQTRGIERGNDIPTATAYNSGGYFTMQNGWTQLSTLGRVGTVIHEARHTAGYYHIPCQTGPYGGASIQACDTNYNYGGSHAVEMEYYARVNLQGENFHPVYKTMARLMAVARSNFVFVQSPLQIKQGLLALDDQNQSHFIFDNKLVSRDTPTAAGALKRTSFGADIFDGIKAFAIELYQNTGIQHKDIEDDYSYFKLLKNDRGQGNAQILDVEEFDHKNNRRYFLYLNENQKLGSYIYAEGQFSASVNAPQNSSHFSTVSPDGRAGLFIISKNLDITELDPENPEQQLAVKAHWPSDTKSFSTYQGQTLALKYSGEVLSDKSGFEFFKNLKISQLVTVPVYNAFEVVP